MRNRGKLRSLSEKAGEVLQRGSHFILRLNNPDGGWPAYVDGKSEPWASAEVLEMLTDFSVTSNIKNRLITRGIDSLFASAIRLENQPKMMYGWKYSEIPEVPADLDVTAFILRVLLKLGVSRDHPIIVGSRDYLLSQREIDVRGRVNIAEGGALYSAAHIASALAHFRPNTKYAWIIHETLQFLQSSQTRSGGWPAYLGGLPDPTYTAYVMKEILALRMHGFKVLPQSKIDTAIEWLKSVQNEDGTWSEWRGITNSIEAAGDIVQTLLRAGQRPDQEVILKAVERLVDSANRNGCWYEYPSDKNECIWISSFCLGALNEFLIALASLEIIDKTAISFSLPSSGILLSPTSPVISTKIGQISQQWADTTAYSKSPSYFDFEIRVMESQPGMYEVSAQAKSAGGARELVQLELNRTANTKLARLRSGGYKANDFKDIGELLFKGIVRGRVEAIYRTCQGVAKAKDRNLRIMLNIEPPRLQSLPWELMYDSLKDVYIGISPDTAISRFLETAEPIKTVTVSRLPLRILVVVCQPVTVWPIDALHELEILQTALSDLVDANMMEIHVLEHGSPMALREKLRVLKPHVVHIISHAEFKNGVGYLLMEDGQRQPNRIDDQTFREIFLGTRVHLAILNSCESATTSAHIEAGLAYNLVQRGLPAVVAMQYRITDLGAIKFTSEFYAALLAGYPVDAATGEGRRAIFIDLGKNDRDWVAPVCFMRARSGKLFAISY